MTAQVGTSAKGERFRAIPEATVARLAGYLRVLHGSVADAGIVSSNQLAALAGVDPAKLRKDLSYLGTHGTRGVGYAVASLTVELERALGAHEVHRVALVGVGRLGGALSGYSGFASRGLLITALFDADPDRIGTTVSGLPIHDVADAAAICRAEAITIGVIATPESAAQEVADVLVAAGVRSILNFAPGHLAVPDGVELRRVDMALELQMLAVHENRRAETYGLSGQYPAGADSTSRHQSRSAS